LDKNDSKQGFSSLVDLASEISEIDKPIKPEPEAKPSSPRQPPQHQRESASPKQERKATSSPQSIKRASKWKSSIVPRDKWILGIIGLILVIGLIDNGSQSSKKPLHNSPSPPLNYSFQQRTPTPAVRTPRAPQGSGVQYKKPSVGTNNVLSIPGIRWCVREGIRIETMRNIIDTNQAIVEFNRIVKEYNSHCGMYRYRRGSKKRAENDVEAFRSQIVAGAIREARYLGRSFRPSHLTKPSTVSKRSFHESPSDKSTREAQQLLADLGYAPGPVDGQYGRRTTDAVKAFQRKVGLRQNGRIDQNLLSALRRMKKKQVRESLD